MKGAAMYYMNYINQLEKLGYVTLSEESDRFLYYKIMLGEALTDANRQLESNTCMIGSDPEIDNGQRKCIIAHAGKSERNYNDFIIRVPKESSLHLLEYPMNRYDRYRSPHNHDFHYRTEDLQSLVNYYVRDSVKFFYNISYTVQTDISHFTFTASLAEIFLGNREITFAGIDLVIVVPGRFNYINARCPLYSPNNPPQYFYPDHTILQMLQEMQRNKELVNIYMLIDAISESGNLSDYEVIDVIMNVIEASKDHNVYIR